MRRPLGNMECALRMTSEFAPFSVAGVLSVRGIHERFGFRPAQVHLAQPKTIPITHNGKVQRGVLRRRYLDGALGQALLYPPRRVP